MGMSINPIRKRFLWSLGLTKGKIKRYKGVYVNEKDVDGISFEWLEYYESEDGEDFCLEDYMFMWLKNNILGLENRGENFCVICTVDDIKALLNAVEEKKFKVYYESNIEFIKDGTSNSRRAIQYKLFDMVYRENAEQYYYIVSQN